MKNLGDLAEDQVIDFTFSTHAGDGTPTTLLGTPSLAVYKANGTTESTAGITLSVDFDSVTGLNHVRIDTSADAFYAVASDYSVVIAAGTVDSVSVVGTTLASFSIENRTTFPKADMPANFSALAIDSDGCVSADIVKIRGSELAAKVLAAWNYAYCDDATVLVDLSAADTDVERATALLAAYAAAKIKTPGGAAISTTNRVAVLVPEAHYDTSAAPLILDTSGIDLLAVHPQMGGHRRRGDTNDVTYFKPPQTLIYSTAYLGTAEEVSAVVQACSDVRMRGFGIAHLDENGVTAYSSLYVSANDNGPSFYDQMYFWCTKAGGYDRFPVGFAYHVKGTWTNCIANTNAWRIKYGPNDSVFSATMIDCEAGNASYIGDYKVDAVNGNTNKATQCRLIRCKSIGGTETYDGAYSFSGCGTWSTPIDSSCYFEDCDAGQSSFGVGCTVAGTFIRCRAGVSSYGYSASDVHKGNFSGYAEECFGGQGSFGGVISSNPPHSKLSGTLVRCVITGNTAPLCVEGATITDSIITVSDLVSDADCLTLITNSNSKISGSTLIAQGTGKAINAASALSFAGGGNHYGGGLGANVTNTGTGDEATLTAAYDHAKDDVLTPLAVVDGNVDSVLADTAELQTNQGNWLTATGFATPSDLTTLQSHGDSTWATATGFSTHAPSDVVAALGTGSTLTACATADVSGIPAAVKEAMEAAGSTLASIVEDTGTTLPAAISEIEAGTGGTVDVDIDVEDIIVE